MTKLRKEPGRRLKKRGITKGSIERSQRRKMHRVGGDVLQNELCLLVLNVNEDWKSRHQQSADARLRIVCILVQYDPCLAQVFVVIDAVMVVGC